MRNFLIFSLFGVAFLLTSLIVVACKDNKGSSDVLVGEILYLEGEVTLNSVPASIGDKVVHGNVLITSAGGLAEVKFGNRRVLRTEENTELVIDNVNRIFDLQKGSMGVVQSRAGFFSRNKNWVVQTPTVAAAVRGTIYYTKIENPNTTYFCLCNGKIELQGGNEKMRLEASHHKAVRFIKSGNTMSQEAAGMLYHSDEDIEALIAKAGVEIDWSKIP